MKLLSREEVRCDFELKQQKSKIGQQEEGGADGNW